ncbi:hypothetical protein BASA62_004451 [Batrachochytrium salamandrivorans]|nr:hypothetical protein BASA62_004451 [Batrachochytrium salamandrivorans]
MLASVVIGAIMATGWSSASATRTIVEESTLSSLKTFHAVLSRFMYVVGFDHCSTIHNTLTWDCGELCGGAIAGTTILAGFKHDIASIRGTGVGDDWKSNIYLNRRSGSWFNTLWDPTLPKPPDSGDEIVAPDNILLHSGFMENYHVPRTPPKVLGYRHFDQEYYIRGDNVTVSCTATKEGDEASDCVNSKRFRLSRLAHTTGYYWPSGCDDLRI